MTKAHHYQAKLEWLGNRGTGTSGYAQYDRSYTLDAEGKPSIPGSSDPAFRGDRSKWNPEELLVGALSACHQLWYLHLCADSGIIVTAYRDEAHGTMIEEKGGSGNFEKVVLRPEVTIADSSRREEALRLHERAHEMCFLARSMNFPVRHEPTVRIDVPAGPSATAS